MRLSTIAVLLVLAQDGRPSAKVLADSITNSDPAASFRAISDLVDLADTQREAVEKEAARLPAFYRDVLLSEMKTKRALGSQFGAGVRINLKVEGRSFWDLVEEVGRQPGMAVKIEEWNRKYSPTKPLDIDLKDAWGVEALARLCEQVRHRCEPSWLDNAWHFRTMGDGLGQKNPPPPQVWFFYRNIGIQVGNRWRKVIDFNGREQDWTALVALAPTVGPDTPVVLWKDLKVIEALDENGKPLTLSGPEDTALPGFQPNSPSGAPGPMASWTCACTTRAPMRPIVTAASTTLRSAAARGW